MLPGMPPDPHLLRGMFTGYIRTLAIAGLIGTIAVAAEDLLVLLYRGQQS